MEDSIETTLNAAPPLVKGNAPMLLSHRNRVQRLWSPRPLEDYFFRGENKGVHFYLGPAGWLYEKLNNCGHWGAHVGGHVHIDLIAAEWNLIWLMVPEVDTLPEIVSSSDRYNRMSRFIADLDWYAVRERYTELAEDWCPSLLESPRRFLNEVEATRTTFPTKLSIDEMRDRAGCSRVRVPTNASNVISVDFATRKRV